jgi:hypothetical protein
MINRGCRERPVILVGFGVGIANTLAFIRHACMSNKRPGVKCEIDATFNGDFYFSIVHGGTGYKCALSARFRGGPD